MHRVCWEIPQLSRVIGDIYESKSGELTFFVSAPVGLQITVSAVDALSLLAALEDPRVVNIKSWEDPVGLFEKYRGSGSPSISFPIGRTPLLGVEVSDFLAQDALSRTSATGIDREDLDSFADAMYAQVLGIPESATILAWGDARIQTPQDARPCDGTVVVTPESVLAYWQPGRTSLIHTLQAKHSAVTSLQIDVDYKMTALWSVAEYANNDGKSLVGDALVNLEPKFCKDGHANRRALTWFACLSALVEIEAPWENHQEKSKSDTGLGNGGTKL